MIGTMLMLLVAGIIAPGALYRLGYSRGVKDTEQRWSDAVGRVERVEALRRQAMPHTTINYGGEGD